MFPRNSWNDHTFNTSSDDYQKVLKDKGCINLKFINTNIHPNRKRQRKGTVATKISERSLRHKTKTFPVRLSYTRLSNEINTSIIKSHDKRLMTSSTKVWHHVIVEGRTSAAWMANVEPK